MRSNTFTSKLCKFKILLGNWLIYFEQKHTAFNNKNLKEFANTRFNLTHFYIIFRLKRNRTLNYIFICKLKTKFLSIFMT